MFLLTGFIRVPVKWCTIRFGTAAVTGFLMWIDGRAQPGKTRCNRCEHSDLSAELFPRTFVRLSIRVKTVSQSHAQLCCTEDWKIRILIKRCTFTTGGHRDIRHEILWETTHGKMIRFKLYFQRKCKWGQIPMQAWQIILSSGSVKCTKAPQILVFQNSEMAGLQIPQIFSFAFCTRPRMTPSSCVTTCLWCLSLTPADHMHTEEGEVPVKRRRVQQWLNTNRYEICTETRWARPLLSAHVRAFQHDKWAPSDKELRRLTVSKCNY